MNLEQVKEGVRILCQTNHKLKISFWYCDTKEGENPEHISFQNQKKRLNGFVTTDLLNNNFGQILAS